MLQAQAPEHSTAPKHPAVAHMAAHLLSTRPAGLVWKNERGARSTRTTMASWVRELALTQWQEAVAAKHQGIETAGRSSMGSGQGMMTAVVRARSALRRHQGAHNKASWPSTWTPLMQLLLTRPTQPATCRCNQPTNQPNPPEHGGEEQEGTREAECDHQPGQQPVHPQPPAPGSWTSNTMLRNTSDKTLAAACQTPHRRVGGADAQAKPPTSPVQAAGNAEAAQHRTLALGC